jgi:hypothetical protein
MYGEPAKALDGNSKSIEKVEDSMPLTGPAGSIFLFYSFQSINISRSLNIN